MNEDLKLKLIKGTPILLEKSNCILYHRTVGEVIDFGYSSFNSIVRLFTLTDEEVQDTYSSKNITLFTFFLINFVYPTACTAEIKKGFNFFLNASKITTDLSKGIFLLTIGDINNIEFSEESFLELSSQISVMYNGEIVEDNSRLNKKEKAMKEKFDRLKKIRERAKGSTDSGLAFSDLLGGFIMRNSALSFEETLALPYYTFFFLLKKLRKCDDYDWQLQALLAGAKNEKEIHHWLEADDDN